jgi:hypothetical protein
MAVHALSLYGWGRACERQIGLQHAAPPLSVALGLALVIALGGVFNLFGLAYRPVLWTVLGVGLALAWWARRGATPPLARGISLSAFLVIITVLIVVSSTLIPPLCFNYHDDYQKYFVHPLRMLQTGRVFGSSLSAIGFETLGGQAWLHGFVLCIAGVEALNAVDLGFGFALCIALAGLGASQSRELMLARGLAIALLLMLNPQILNIASTFTGAALCLALVVLHMPHALVGSLPGRAHALGSGLIFAALCALKTSFVLPVALLAATCSVALALRTRDIAAAARWFAVSAGTTLLAISPWLLVHAANYLAAWRMNTPQALTPSVATRWVNPLSLDPILYGDDGIAPYTIAVAVCLIVSLITWFSAPRSDQGRAWPAHAALAISASLAAVYVSMLYVVAPLSQGVVTIMRLFAPMLLGILPGVLLLTSSVRLPRRLNTLCLLLVALVLVPFRSGLPTRVAQAFQDGSVLAFSNLATKPDYIEYSQYVLYGRMREQVAAAQAAVPAGAAVVAWLNAPFWLDFKRNPISDLEHAGLATPWAAIPPASYVIWEFNGRATGQLVGYQAALEGSAQLERRILEAGLRLVHALIDLSHQSQIVHDDGQIMVLRLPTPTALAERYHGR